ncbi:MAG: PKD domain-containing protein [Phycisphaerae bacterium]|jgi:WD40 repeat protein
MRLSRTPALFYLAAAACLLPLVISGCPGTGTTDGDGNTTPTFNTPPAVVLMVDVIRGIAPLTVTFSSVGSTDDSLIVARQWDFGDGTTSRDISPSHTFETTGEYTVTLTLTDDAGADASRSVIITVTQAPVAVFTVDNTTAPSPPALFSFDASDSYDPDGEIVHYQWDFGDGSRELIPVLVHTFATAGTYRVRLTVTDDTGVTDSTSRIIQVGIPEPEVSFRLPPDDAPNIAVSPDSPLWVVVEYDSEPGVPRTIRAGLDADRDPCDAQAALYEVLTGDLDRRFTGPDDRVTSVVISPAGTQALVGSEDGTVSLYTLNATTTTGLTLAEVNGLIDTIAYSPNGGLYAYGTNTGTVVVRDAVTNVVIHTFNDHTGGVNGLAFSADGLRLASGSDDASAIVYDAATGNIIRVLDTTADANGHATTITAVAFAPNNSNLLVTASTDTTAKLWRVEQGDVISTFAGGHSAAINAIAFSPSSEFIMTGGEDSRALYWNILGTPATVERTFTCGARVTSVAFSPDGLSVLTGSGDGTATLWNLATGEQEREFTPCTSAISSVDFSPDGEQILLGIGARNSIQLDTDPPTGDDMNLTMPAALDLSVLAPDQYPGTYFLWAEIDTDRTEPVREYATLSNGNPQRFNVIRPFTTTVSVDTPRVPLIDDKAEVLVAATTSRQIFDLGALRRGDRVHLSLLTTPGYSETYTAERYSVMMLDYDTELFTWYQAGLLLFDADAKLIIGHDSPNYYFVVDGCRPPECTGVHYGQSLSIELERQVGLTPRAQRVYLDFSGATNLTVGNDDPVSFGAFSANSINAAWGASETITIKAAILARLNTIFGAYNIVFTDTDTPGFPPALPYQTVYFGGSKLDPTSFGTVAYVDPRNDTLGGVARVAVENVVDEVGNTDTAVVGLSLGNAAAKFVAILMGLRVTTGGNTDLMDADAPVNSPALQLMRAPLDDRWQYNGQIGIQDAPQLLQELVGSP